jgi:hypothetical protein
LHHEQRHVRVGVVYGCGQFLWLHVQYNEDGEGE